jgi:hypothetical protein
MSGLYPLGIAGAANRDQVDRDDGVPRNPMGDMLLVLMGL